MAIKRVGILTGGGDVPGLNSVIKSATYRSNENDIEIFGLRRGCEALTHLNFEDSSSRSHYVIQLTRENTRAKAARSPRWQGFSDRCKGQGQSLFVFQGFVDSAHGRLNYVLAPLLCISSRKWLS